MLKISRGMDVKYLFRLKGYFNMLGTFHTIAKALLTNETNY